MDNTSFDLVLNGNVLETVSSMKILGINIDDCLLWRNQVDIICTKVYQMSGLLWRIKHYLTFDTRKLFYYSYILPVFSHRSVTKNCIFLVTGPGLTKTPF